MNPEVPHPNLTRDALIKSIEIEGFRSLRHVRLDLRPLNVLIGPNQSGKTNILDALDFLAQAVQGKLSPALYHSRGGLANLLWAGKGAKHDPVSDRVRARYGHLWVYDRTAVRRSCDCRGIR